MIKIFNKFITCKEGSRLGKVIYKHKEIGQWWWDLITYTAQKLLSGRIQQRKEIKEEQTGAKAKTMKTKINMTAIIALWNLLNSFKMDSKHIVLSISLNLNDIT